MLAVVFLSRAAGFFSRRGTADAVGYGGGLGIFNGGVLFLGDALVSVGVGLMVDCVEIVWEVCLHWRVLSGRGIGACLRFLGGLFCCWVAGC